MLNMRDAILEIASRDSSVALKIGSDGIACRIDHGPYHVEFSSDDGDINSLEEWLNYWLALMPWPEV
jgi:hypothetical protein